MSAAAAVMRPAEEAARAQRLLAAPGVERLLSPALLIDLDAVRENLRRVLARVGTPERWRPHVKTLKMPALFLELARAGVRQFKCATLREARTLLESLGAAGIAEPDVLLAQPLVGPALELLGELARKHARASLSVLCEDPALVAHIPAHVGIFIDLDAGMRRTGIPESDLPAIRAVARSAGARLRGLHHYEGHLHGPGEERRERCFEGYRRLLAIEAALAADGAAVGELITSGTPAFLHALEFEGFLHRGDRAARHRVSPGTVVLHDMRSAQQNPGLELVPAALVLARVLSCPAADRVTCDAGSKSVAAEAGDPCARVLGRPELIAQRPSEEHLPLRVLSGPAPRRGDLLLLVPLHVCPTVNLAEEALLVEGGRLLASAPVSARAH